MSNFGENLKEMMQLRGLNALQLEKETGCSNPNILSWVKFGTFPKLSSLIVLSEYFECSLDFLTGRVDENDFNGALFVDTFANRLLLLKIKSGMSYSQIAKTIGVQRTQFTHWTRGANPTLGNLLKLADYFGCSLDYLAGRALSF